MNKAILTVLITTTSALSSINEVNLTDVIEQFSRRNSYLIQEYLRACSNGENLKAFNILKATQSRPLNLLSRENASGKPAKICLVEIKDAHGMTGLMLAAKKGNAELIETILPFHTDHDIQLQDGNGHDALYWAEYDTGSSECLDIICAALGRNQKK